MARYISAGFPRRRAGQSDGRTIGEYDIAIREQFCFVFCGISTIACEFLIFRFASVRLMRNEGMLIRVNSFLKEFR